ncbi:hypothetical protein FraEuI1c_6810 [Pseudofrankia inefficax]|uniref:Uncharacterized protein n=1 Tax=Pseudofrankia inefficax (strain DSM 45817 / CECT 9037 / DDB 130130 / EuI1c) TaxID=298654 RepID=E3JDL3_PSEI1|nr:hypothetical protein FraEuI1c_6810 [Pseudofrankia inefficax]
MCRLCSGFSAHRLHRACGYLWITDDAVGAAGQTLGAVYRPSTGLPGPVDAPEGRLAGTTPLAPHAC